MPTRTSRPPLARRALPFLLVMPLLVAAASCRTADTDASPDGAAAFRSPEAAVPQIREMLRAERWADLAAYYDLSGSPVARADLVSGNFFLERDTRAMRQPREVSRYRHPFPPAFDLQRVIPTDDPDVVIVEMAVSIDQGEGMPAQRGVTWFKMSRTGDGWRILPDTVTSADVPAS